MLPVLVLLPLLAAAEPAPPACIGHTDVVSRVICADVTLVGEDAQVQELYLSALKLPAPQRVTQEARQAAWLHTRAACAAIQDVRGCIADQLGRRSAELQIVLERMPVFAAATYLCPGAPPIRVHAAYYRSTPAAVRLTFPGQDLIAFVAPSGSGARYTGEGAEIWEHQGVARFTWSGVQKECPKK